MIIKAEFINQPVSGEYKEKIYDIRSRWLLKLRRKILEEKSATFFE